MSDSLELPVDQANFDGTTEPFTAGSVDDLAAESSLDGRFQKDAILQYQYAPAIGRQPAVTSVARQLPDGSTVADVIITFTVKKGLLYEVEFSQASADPELYANLRESPVRLYNKPTNLSVRARVRTRHPVSGLEGDWSPYGTVTTAQDTTLPSPPTTPAVTPDPSDGTRMAITWGGSPSADAATYQLWRNGVAITSFGTALSWPDTGLSLGTQYNYQARCADRTGNLSAFSGIGAGITANEAPVDVSLGLGAVIKPALGSYTTIASRNITMPTSNGGRRLRVSFTIVTVTYGGGNPVDVYRGRFIVNGVPSVEGDWATNAAGQIVTFNLWPTSSNVGTGVLNLAIQVQAVPGIIDNGNGTIRLQAASDGRAIL